LYNDLKTVKQSPDLERLIDLRQLFDSKINFAKASRDVSSSLDPLSRSVRSSIAETAKKIVGKSEAANVQKYADFMEGYNALRGFTDKRTGAEFLLKQALSERGRLPREVMNAVKEFTGVDLMDDAVMAIIATDLIGNTRQKGLFRQEITKAGLDVNAILSGDKGAVSALIDWGKGKLIDEEKQFLKAAGYGRSKLPATKSSSAIPSTGVIENAPTTSARNTTSTKNAVIPTTIPKGEYPVNSGGKMYGGFAGFNPEQTRVKNGAWGKPVPEKPLGPKNEFAKLSPEDMQVGKAPVQDLQSVLKNGIDKIPDGQDAIRVSDSVRKLVDEPDVNLLEYLTYQLRSSRTRKGIPAEFLDEASPLLREIGINEDLPNKKLADAIHKFLRGE